MSIARAPLQYQFSVFCIKWLSSSVFYLNLFNHICGKHIHSYYNQLNVTNTYTNTSEGIQYDACCILSRLRQRVLPFSRVGWSRSPGDGLSLAAATTPLRPMSPCEDIIENGTMVAEWQKNFCRLHSLRLHVLRVLQSRGKGRYAYLCYRALIGLFRRR